MSNALKQLKKNDFLAHITEKPMTRGQLVDALEEFEYVSSYLDYLTDHFMARGMIVQNEDGTINRKPRKGSAPKAIFRVVEGENGPELESKGNVGVLSEEDKEAGWSVTANAAVKKASSAIFQDYKDRTAAVKALLVADESEEDETGEDAE